jgi:hypothetical protein
MAGKRTATTIADFGEALHDNEHLRSAWIKRFDCESITYMTSMPASHSTPSAA